MNRLVVALKVRLRGLKLRLVEMILAPVVTGKNSRNAVDASNESSSRQVYCCRFGSLRLINFLKISIKSYFFLPLLFALPPLAFQRSKAPGDRESENAIAVSSKVS